MSRFDKEQIVKGFGEYIEKEVIYKMQDDKALQIMLTVAVTTVLANQSIVDKIFENQTVKDVLKYEEEKGYDLDDLFDNIKESINKFGYFPIIIPPISKLPFIKQAEKELKFHSSDVDKLKEYISTVS